MSTATKTGRWFDAEWTPEQNGSYCNLFAVECLPGGHSSDSRGDLMLAVISEGPRAGTLVEVVWGHECSLKDVVHWSGADFAWVNKGYVWETGKEPFPSIARIHRRWHRAGRPCDTAKRLRQIANIIDPQDA